MKTKTTSISILIAAALIGGTIVFSGGGKDSNTNTASANNVSVVDEKQVITIVAKGGYSPKVTTAKAGMPTVLEVNTNGTFDCSSALTIPSLGYRNYLPPSGKTAIDIPPQEVGATVRGLCAMGMYNFTVNFN